MACMHVTGPDLFGLSAVALQDETWEYVGCRTASRWHLGAVITGQTNVAQLKEYLSAFDVTLDEETLEEVDRIHCENRNPNWSD